MFNEMLTTLQMSLFGRSSRHSRRAATAEGTPLRQATRPVDYTGLLSPTTSSSNNQVINSPKIKKKNTFLVSNMDMGIVITPENLSPFVLRMLHRTPFQRLSGQGALSFKFILSQKDQHDRTGLSLLMSHLETFNNPSDQMIKPQTKEICGKLHHFLSLMQSASVDVAPSPVAEHWRPIYDYLEQHKSYGVMRVGYDRVILNAIDLIKMIYPEVAELEKQWFLQPFINGANQLSSWTFMLTGMSPWPRSGYHEVTEEDETHGGQAHFRDHDPSAQHNSVENNGAQNSHTIPNENTQPNGAADIATTTVNLGPLLAEVAAQYGSKSHMI